MLIPEGRQELKLSPSWNACKWDASEAYAHGIGQAFSGLEGARGVKAADLVASRDGVAPVLMIGEFKDFAHPSIPKADRKRVAAQAVSLQLVESLIAKVIDTLAGATFARGSAGSREPVFNRWRDRVGSPEAALLILVMVEFPDRQASSVLALQTRLKQQLFWLGQGARVAVICSSTDLKPYRRLGIEYRVL